MAGPARPAPARERLVRERGEILQRHIAGLDAAPEVVAVEFDDPLAVAVPSADRVRIPVLRGAVHPDDALGQQNLRAGVAGDVAQVEDLRPAGMEVE